MLGIYILADSSVFEVPVTAINGQDLLASSNVGGQVSRFVKVQCAIFVATDQIKQARY